MPKRLPSLLVGSWAFTGLSQQISISDCDLDSLYSEVDTIWSEDPGPAVLGESLWIVNRVKARAMAFAAKGPVLAIKAFLVNGQLDAQLIHGQLITTDKGKPGNQRHRAFHPLRISA